MKKSYSKLVVAGAMAVAFSVVGNAQAAVSLDNGTGLNTYASEVAGQVAFNDAVDADTKVVMPVGAVPYVRLTCDAAFVTANPGIALTSVGGTTIGAGIGDGVKSGGIGVKSITFQETLAVAAMAKTDVWSFTATQIAITSGEIVGCTYELFETATHWAQGNATVSTTNNIVKWGEGLLLRAGDSSCEGVSGCTSTNYATIDLTADGKKFTGNSLQGRIATVNLNARTTDAVKDAAGANVTWGGMVDATSTATNLVVSGDFSAYTKVWFEGAGGACNSYSAAAAAVVNADKTTATFSNTQIATAWGADTLTGRTVANSGQVCAEVDGNTVMEESTYSAVVNLKPGSGFNVPAATTIGLVGDVADNGTSDTLNLVLTPGGAYAGYIRISHVGQDAGDVSLTVINDNGDKAVVKLGDIAGQSTSTLAALASTSQMSVSDIYAAAQAADATFATTGDNKLRIVVKSTSTTGINASIYSLSKDGNSFALINE